MLKKIFYISCLINVSQVCASTECYYIAPSSWTKPWSHNIHLQSYRKQSQTLNLLAGKAYIHQPYLGQFLLTPIMPCFTLFRHGVLFLRSEDQHTCPFLILPFPYLYFIICVNRIPPHLLTAKVQILYFKS